MRDYEIRLVGHDSDDGEIMFDDLDRVGKAVKDLVYRLTREAADRAGAGRAPRVLEDLSAVRVGMQAGSTRLIFRVGVAGSLGIDPVADEVDRAFWEIVNAFHTGKRPSRVTDTVADAALRLADGLSRASEVAEIHVHDLDVVRLRTTDVALEIWRSQDVEVREVTVHGELQMVDLKTARFRLSDAGGNDIDLVDVHDHLSAGRLVGSQVTARGLLKEGVGAQHHRLLGARVSARVPVEDRLRVPQQTSLDALVASARSAPQPQPLDLTDEEFESFVSAFRG